MVFKFGTSLKLRYIKMELKHQDDILALIARNLAGLADSVETTQLKEWIGALADNSQYFEQIKNIWDASDKQIDPKKINTSEALENVLDRIPKVSPKRNLLVLLAESCCSYNTPTGNWYSSLDLRKFSQNNFF